MNTLFRCDLHLKKCKKRLACVSVQRIRGEISIAITHLCLPLMNINANDICKIETKAFHNRIYYPPLITDAKSREHHSYCSLCIVSSEFFSDAFSGNPLKVIFLAELNMTQIIK
jgi:hypothetical protein